MDRPDAMNESELPCMSLASRSPTAGDAVECRSPAACAEVTRAVERARAAQRDWGRRSPRERAGFIRRLRDVVVENAGRIARTDHEETGKLELEAKGMVLPVIDACGYYASLAESFERDRSIASAFLVGRECSVAYRPAGVVAVISPWNFPFLLAMNHIVPALAAGNAVIHKPSEHATKVGLLIGELCQAAHIPGDVLQVLVGAGDVGHALVDAGVDVVSFTGNSRTGVQVMQTAAKHLTPVLLELGGKDAAIVCEDADLERAIHGIAWGAFLNAGQTCVAPKRAIVARPIYGSFVERIAREANDLAQAERDLGPLTLEGAIERLERQVAQSVALGARVAAGGRRLRSGSNVYAPTVLVDCSPDMPAVREETFGPLVTVLRADGDAEAIALANASEFGLSASVWTRDGNRAMSIARQLDTGSVAINDVLSPAANARLPFGGTKRSGVGRASGEVGYLQYCNVQSIVVARFPGKRDPHWYPYPRHAGALLDRAIGLCHGSLVQKVRRMLG